MSVYIKKVYKQHSSLVVTLNKLMCAQLQISRGDYIVFEVKAGRQEASLVKYGRRKGDKHESPGHTGRIDNGRRTLAEARNKRGKAARARLIDL